MARLISRPFDPTQPVYARRPFVAAGRGYNPGDLFDWPRLAVAQRRVFLLYEAGKLMHKGDVDTPPLERATPLPQVAVKPIEQEMQDAEILAAAAGVPMAAVAEPGPVDDLDDLSMKELRAIAEAEGAPSRVSRALQREAIREHRSANSGV